MATALAAPHLGEAAAVAGVNEATRSAEVIVADHADHWPIPSHRAELEPLAVSACILRDSRSKELAVVARILRAQIDVEKNAAARPLTYPTR